MSLRLRLRLLLLSTLLAACASRPPEVPLAAKQRGMSFACANSRGRNVRYGSEPSMQALRDVKELGADWISITPFGFQRGGIPEIRFGGTGVWETDESLVEVTKQAHTLGMKVMLKPHVWGRETAATPEWFASYERFITHYATLARDTKADAFCIGNEQKHSTKHEAEWRRIIASVRAIYPGPITYGANFDEIFDVPFWDAVDTIGVSAYFPLSDQKTPSKEALIAAWQPILAKLEALSIAQRKPILFTEIGYRSADGAAWRQWELPRQLPLNLDAQTRAYEAFFEAVWPQPWLAGVYPWKWYSYPGHGGMENNDYFIEGKPAAEVVRRHYRTR